MEGSGQPVSTGRYFTLNSHADRAVPGTLGEEQHGPRVRRPQRQNPSPAPLTSALHLLLPPAGAQTPLLSEPVGSDWCVRTGA